LIRVVLDTNVLISALLFGGKPQSVLEKAIRGHVGLVLSRDILNELEGVLLEKKFFFPQEIARSLVLELEAMAEMVAPSRTIMAVKADPYDNMILECAFEAKVDFVVSGDKHLLELKRFEKIPILSPAQFLEVIE
jgi:uncharacterized protein